MTAAAPAIETAGTRAPPTAAEGLRSTLADRWILAFLIAGFLFRLGIGIGIHHHFRDANPPHLWQGTDEANYYSYGKKAADLLKSDGWNAFLEAPPSADYFNWMFFKYTGLVLAVVGDSPFALRLLSILFSIAGILLFLAALPASFSGKFQRRFFAALLCLFPSFAFWSALAIKEGTILFLTGLFCWGLARLWKRPTPWPALAFAAVVCVGLGCFRIWAGIGFFLIAAAVLMLCHPGRPKALYLLPAAMAVLVALWFIPSIQLLICKHAFGWETTYIHGWKLNRKHKLKPLKHQRVQPPAIERISLLEDTDLSIPVKVFLAWLLPLPGLPRDNALAVMSGFENVLFLGLFFLAYAGARRKLSSLEKLWLGLGLLILLAAFLVGTRLGTIYRTKMASLPFIVYFAACALPGALDSVRRLASKRVG
jgi:hypothetical protein